MSEITEAPKTAKASQEYWFARRFPKDNPRNSMGPVHWKGWVAFALFVMALIGGGLMFLLLAIWGAIWIGLIAYALVAWGALMALLKIVAMKGDQTKSTEDYMKAGRDVAH